MLSRYGVCKTCVQWAACVLLSLATGVAFAQDPSASAVSTGPQSRTILVVGDSLSASYGIDAADGWVSLLGKRLVQQRPPWRVVNASISGETSAGGAARIISEVVRHRPALVVIELGANDGLRGLPLSDLRRNLARMVGASHGVGAKVLVIGMRLPPNYGPAYTEEFDRGFCDIARRFDAACLPFLLDPIARDRSAFQDDNLHPVAGVQSKLRDHVWKALVPLLE